MSEVLDQGGVCAAGAAPGHAAGFAGEFGGLRAYFDSLRGRDMGEEMGKEEWDCESCEEDDERDEIS